MERWSGRVALVTGVSSGIGAATVKELVKHGLKVVGVARRIDRVEKLASELKGQPGTLYPLKADISKEEDVLQTFHWIDENLGGVDIVINNAAVLYAVQLSDVSSDKLQQMFDINVIGLCLCTREALKSMKKRGINDGHIVHINSIAGHYVVNTAGLAAYSSTKHSVTALTEGLRRELVQQKSKIKITAISPGAVDTEMVRNSDLELPGGKKIEDFPLLSSKDIADAIIYALGTPPHVQVHDIIIKPLGEEQ